MVIIYNNESSNTKNKFCVWFRYNPTLQHGLTAYFENNGIIFTYINGLCFATEQERVLFLLKFGDRL